ncbi:MAG: nucleoside triphosphate pyrophosphohydrolase [Syntrophaceae bacterium]|nr:nucleoside triphosphate pyrophosphohydrolase [Syntrophaceae bacterium]
MKKIYNENIEKLKDLILLIKKLRAPDGCPWDRQQKKEDIGKYILEEAYEVIDCLTQSDSQALKEELGDLLFQILFITEISTESDLFSLGDVLDEINEKMIRRHPHIFGNIKVTSVQKVKDNWQKIKIQEHKNKKSENDLFADIPRSLPALKRAQKITSIVSTYGFDWKDAKGILKKIGEEIQELHAAAKTGNSLKIEEELGDILFTVVNLSRFLSIDAETALSKTTEKFLRRFSYITEQVSSLGIKLEEATPAQMETLWNEAKTKGLK